MMPVNFWAVLAAAIASMVIGSVWYGPLFGKKFMAEMGMNEWSEEKKTAMKKSMLWSYLGQFAASLLMFYVLAGIVAGFGHTTLGGGALTGFIMWAGFVFPLILGELCWGGKKSLFWMKCGNMLLTLLAAGAIIGAWR